MAVSTIDPAGLNIGQIGGRRNLLINSGFDVWQRGSSFTGAGYTADRWIVSTTDTNTAITKTANRDKRNTLRITFNSGVNANIDQRIEAFGNVGYNQQVTLSFWVRGSIATTGTDICRIRNHTTATTLESFTYDITTSWTKVTKTFSANNTWSKDDVARLYLFINGASSAWASGDWVEFSDVQLEVGDVATPFEHRSYGEELSACQRYYQRQFPATGGGVVKSSGNGIARVKCPLVQIMRVSPSVTKSGNPSVYDGSSTANISSLDGVWSTPHLLEFDGNLSATLNAEGRACMIYNDATQATGNLSSAGFILDAEL